MTRRLAGRPSPPGTTLYQQVRFARIWLPLVIVGVVLVHQLLVVPLGGEAWSFWSQLLFYSILGPAATYVTLNWIAEGVRQREETQAELTKLYTELQASHELLGSIQKVTERFAAAPDLEATMAAASEGITEVTGAVGAAVLLGTPGVQLRDSSGLSPELEAAAAERAELLLTGNDLPEQVTAGGGEYRVLTAAVAWGGKLEGSIHAFYREVPASKQREAFGILAAEFSAAAEAAYARTRDLLTLFDVDRSIRAEGNLERLLESLLSQMMNRVGATLGGVYLADEDGLLQLRAAHGLPRGGVDAVRPGKGLVGRVASEGQPQLLDEVSEELRAQGSPLLQSAGSAVALPLQAEGSVVGVVILGHERPGRFDRATLPFLGLLAGQVSLAVRNARAYLHSEELAIAEERARIAREIHDGVAQSLAFAALKLDLVERLLGRDPKKAAEELAVARATIRETIKEVRRSIFALRPVDLERYGFLETMRRYLVDYGQQNDIRVEFEVQGAANLSLKAETVLFRIFQEAMNNVAKHAGAAHVRVVTGRTPDGLGFVSVEDDGRGFDLAQVSDRVTSAGGLGLRQMRERVEARGGRFEIDTAPGRGTRVFASVAE